MLRFRIATYNIHKARGMDRRTRVERIGRVLKEVQADIVALQEVVNHEGGTVEDHQARYLAHHLDCFHAVGETRKHHGSIYGNVTLSRWGFDQVQCADLTVDGRERRGALRTDVRVAGYLLHIFNVHLGTGIGERRLQAPLLVNENMLRAVDISGPRILLGDFNEWTSGLVTRTLSAEFHRTRLRDHLPRTRNYPALFPFLNLDHIYYDHHIQVERAHFHRSATALIASDHLPLIADLVVAD